MRIINQKHVAMKKSVIISMVLGASLVFFGCSEDNFVTPALEHADLETTTLKSAKPAPKLVGTTHTDFTLTPPTFWNGTIDFEEQGVYGLTFISHTAPRDYSQASPFSEDFIIYELGTDWQDPANVLMKGTNAGVVVLANKVPEPVKVIDNGEITEAYGIFSEWDGRQLHFSGMVYWLAPGLPDYCDGVMRIN